MTLEEGNCVLCLLKLLSVNVSAGTDIGRGIPKQPAI